MLKTIIIKTVILIPYPASKKDIKSYEKGIKSFFKMFPKIFIVVDLLTVLGVSILLTLFVEELKTSNLIEFGGLVIGMQFQLIIPVTIISLFVAIVVLVIKGKK